MLCALTARRVKPGTANEFIAAFKRFERELPEEINARWTRLYICRDVTDEEVVLTFGFFNGTLKELQEVQSHHNEPGGAARIATSVEQVLLDGLYEVLEEITP